MARRNSSISRKNAPQALFAAPQSVIPRLLTREQAATYCGVSIATLTALCPVKPIALGDSKRLERYDICHLDEWIDSLREDSPKSGKDWLAALDGSDDNRSR